MTDFKTTVQQLQRSRLLIHAARMGLGDYRRERDLRRIGHMSLHPEQALPHLLEKEERIEDKRRKGDVGYCIAQHIDLLIAVLGEVRLIRAPSAPQS